MDTNKILSADLLDLIFDDRNKEYGAYDLRRNYHIRITKSLVFTGVFITLVFTGVVLANKLEPKRNPTDSIKAVTLIAIEPEKPEQISEPLKKPEPIQVQTEKLTNITITKDEDVEDTPPEQTDLIDSEIGLTKTDGAIDNGLSVPSNLDEGKDIIENKIAKESTEFLPIEIEAKFDGDWIKFLFKNLNPQVPIDNGAPAGNYIVVLQFVVDVDGTVSDIKPLTNHGYGLEQEAIRVLRKAKKWEPAIQNGRKVKAYRKQPITFQVTEE
ncbi:MAG TPA: energy transducer TonB [Chitinophagaceae bacterium]|nr:energy transducer TonB [Chitinophagaceae bacterium]